MVSIPHYEDMSAQRIYDSLDLMWWPSEKLDGSYLRAGLDDQGAFYTQRKGGEPCYTVDDWPDECWASTYRIGHTVAGMLIEALVKENLIANGESVGTEIIQGTMPNTVPYFMDGSLDGTLVVTATDFAITSEMQNLLKDFRCHFPQGVRESIGGQYSQIFDEHQIWQVKLNPQISRELVHARLASQAKQFKHVLDHWFPQESKVEGFTVFEILDLNLSKKHPNCGTRNWNDLKKDLVKERDELRGIFRDLTLMFKSIAYNVLVDEQPSCIGPGSFKEGVVVNSNQGLFKIVDRNLFSEANRFTHTVKYWIVGGRRPARPSFLSRTKDWPKEKRLARLDQLLVRYKENHYTMHYQLEAGARSMLLSYSGQLHQRTLNMFSDTRKRIQDGR